MGTGNVSGVIMAWTVGYAWRRLIVHPDPPLPQRQEYSIGSNRADNQAGILPTETKTV